MAQRGQGSFFFFFFDVVFHFYSKAPSGLNVEEKDKDSYAVHVCTFLKSRAKRTCVCHFGRLLHLFGQSSNPK